MVLSGLVQLILTACCTSYLSETNSDNMTIYHQRQVNLASSEENLPLKPLRSDYDNVKSYFAESRVRNDKSKADVHVIFYMNINDLQLSCSRFVWFLVFSELIYNFSLLPLLGCPAGEEFNDCGTSCQMTCKNYQHPPRICRRKCVAGCFCIEGMVRDTSSGRCVTPDACGKFDSEHVYKLQTCAVIMVEERK